MKKLLTLLSTGTFMAIFAAGAVLASGHLLNPFTQEELDENWEADRQFPTGGVLSVNEFGREDVARIGIDGINKENIHSDVFRRTEGIKTKTEVYNNFGNLVQVDLYLDPDWEEKAVRAGFWVVGDDGEGARDNRFGIIEFVNLEPSIEGSSSPTGDHEGWRFWDSTNGWTHLNTPFSYGEWVTLTIELDTDEEEYNFYINGELVGTGPGGTSFIRELFLNSYNYGLDKFENLSNVGYEAHWHVGLEVASDPLTKDECKQDGWVDFGFYNQGLCIQYVNTDKDSR